MSLFVPPPSISAQPTYAVVWQSPGDPKALWEQVNDTLDGLRSLTSSYASAFTFALR